MTKKETAVVVSKNEQSVESFISQAIDKGVTVETMERLFNLRKEVKAEMAREAFVSAMAQFQSECPIISKEKPVKGKDGVERYRYAPLDEIVRQVKVYLGRNGLSYNFDEKIDKDSVTAICKITHTLGHSETSVFSVPIGSEQYMTDVQKHGARITFAKRYAFCNAFGILTGDEDTDAADLPKNEEKPADSQNDVIDWKTRLEATQTLRELSRVWAGMPNNVKKEFEGLKDELKVKLGGA